MELNVGALGACNKNFDLRHMEQIPNNSYFQLDQVGDLLMDNYMFTSRMQFTCHDLSVELLEFIYKSVTNGRNFK